MNGVMKMGSNEITRNELLELSAKAYGIELEYRSGSDAYYYDNPETGREQWCPDDDDGQAMRLLVKCGISFSFVGYGMEMMVVAGGIEIHPDGDPIISGRLIITIAAAEIGKRMA